MINIPTHGNQLQGLGCALLTSRSTKQKLCSPHSSNRAGQQSSCAVRVDLQAVGVVHLVSYIP